MVIVKGVPQAVVQHGINRLPMAHFLAAARIGQHMGGQAHILHATGHNHFRVAGYNGLCGKMHRLESGAADFIDGHGGCFYT